MTEKQNAEQLRDAITAWLEGKPIEWRRGNSGWTTYLSIDVMPFLIQAFQDIEWRAKREIKRLYCIEYPDGLVLKSNRDLKKAKIDLDYYLTCNYSKDIRIVTYTEDNEQSPT